jgi:hypothetical protein
MPEQDACSPQVRRNMQAVMNLVWEKLLPALKAAFASRCRLSARRNWEALLCGQFGTE